MASMLDYYAGGLPFKSGTLPLLKHKCGKQQLATMLAIKRSAGVTLEGMYNMLSTNWTAHSRFETQRCHQNYKTEVSMAP